MLTVASLRQEVANLASRERGSTDSAKYWREVLPASWRGPFPPQWCGAFTLWALRVALGCPWQWEIGRGYLYRLRPTSDPDLGDVCYMDQPYQHHAILIAIGTDADGASFVISQDGNSGNSPGICQENWRKRSAWTTFYSIDPLIKAALLSRA